MKTLVASSPDYLEDPVPLRYTDSSESTESSGRGGTDVRKETNLGAKVVCRTSGESIWSVCESTVEETLRGVRKRVWGQTRSVTRREYKRLRQ